MSRPYVPLGTKKKGERLIINLLIVVFSMGNLVKKYIFLNHLKQHFQNFDTFTRACISLYSSLVMISH